ncbi:universal stress protein [Bosea sp. PAMC 26642]|uniref:universal stress protein n=1 Tax=Bosea sp. (strain PAMC 26642) TaxID=1792307 RepID=UPI00076FEBA4|nr:universal stress protein [Bosea sp. PAMC 26642]AMJ59693.1 hypothetical protein AXW83_04700 [Bosea sp. PAMC 26642]
MAIKDILLQLNSYPDAAPASAIEQGVAIAALLRADITALTFEFDIEVPGTIVPFGFFDIGSLIDAERDKSAANAKLGLDAFAAMATKRGVVHDQMRELCTTARIPGAVIEHARLRDLTIIPAEAPAGFQQYIAECVIFGSGRPVIVVPAKPSRNSQALDAIGIAWDFSRPAARAIADAMTILQAARTVRAVTVTHEKSIETRRSGQDLARHLALHGVTLILDEEDAAGRPIGQALESYADKHGLDLLVMGAYGHWRMRDFFLGGATKSVVGNPTLPIFLSH